MGLFLSQSLCLLDFPWREIRFLHTGRILVMVRVCYRQLLCPSVTHEVATEPLGGYVLIWERRPVSTCFGKTYVIKYHVHNQVSQVKNFSHLLVFGRDWTSINPISSSLFLIFFWRRSPKCLFYSSESSFALEDDDLIFLVDFAWLHWCLIQRDAVFLWGILIPLSGRGGAPWVNWGSWSRGTHWVIMPIDGVGFVV